MQTPKPIPTEPGTQLPQQIPLIITINGGSSSIKFALYSARSALKKVFGGQIERIGMPGTLLTSTGEDSPKPDKQPIAATTFQAGIDAVVSCLRDRIGSAPIRAIGHRIVKGGMHLVDHQLITAEVTAELRRVQPQRYRGQSGIDPSHLLQKSDLVKLK